MEEQAYILRTMLKLQCGNGLMHESVSTQNLAQCTRPVFEWANAMLVRHACTAAQHPHTSGCKPVSLKKQLPGRTIAGDTAYLLAGPAGLLLQHQCAACHTAGACHTVDVCCPFLQVVLVENLLGDNCEEAAEAHRLATIKVWLRYCHA